MYTALYLENHTTSLRLKKCTPSAFGISPEGGDVLWTTHWYLIPLEQAIPRCTRYARYATPFQRKGAKGSDDSERSHSGQPQTSNLKPKTLIPNP